MGYNQRIHLAESFHHRKGGKKKKKGQFETLLGIDRVTHQVSLQTSTSSIWRGGVTDKLIIRKVVRMLNLIH